MLSQYFEHYFKLKTNHNDFDFDNFSQFIKQATQSFSNQDEFTFEELTTMSESNGCITFQFFTNFKEPQNYEYAHSTVKELFTKNFNVVTSTGKKVEIKTDMNNTNYSLFYTNISTKKNLLKSDYKGFLNSDFTFPKGTRYLSINGIMGKKASDNTKLVIAFYDEDKNVLHYSENTPEWIEQFKDLFYSTFTAKDQMYAEYKYISKLLTGNVSESFIHNDDKITFVNERSFLRNKEPNNLLGQPFKMIFSLRNIENYY